MSGVESLGDGDVRERLLPDRTRLTSQNEDEERDAFTHEELLHSIGSFSAVVWPVAVTMLLASFVSLNVVDPASAKALAEYVAMLQSLSGVRAGQGQGGVNEHEGGGRPGERPGHRVVFPRGDVRDCLLLQVQLQQGAGCKKILFHVRRCMMIDSGGVLSQMLIGYMMFSSAMLLGMLGGNMLVIVIAKMEIPVDVFTLLFAMYNFSVVGVLAIFYQKGMPMWLTQTYLVATSVIMAWQLGQFPEWSTWALVIVLAFYDLCAVLTPCGPLKWLVNLVQQEGRPLPGMCSDNSFDAVVLVSDCMWYALLTGLLYEAEIRRDHSGNTAPPVHENVYYQCETEIPLRLGSPHEVPEAPEPTVQTTLTPRQAQLRARLIEFYTKHNPAAISRVDKILERYHGREAELWHDLYQKYVTDEGDVDETIKLGLGDFVFYSVLVSRAAKYDFSAMMGCLVSVLMKTAFLNTILEEGGQKRKT
ncbi:hypothetical protein ON010_g3176 [Phytophthora cinnamomi]|nr:hypothetical protein ON010_g3176 [Phytophthora cinnamomi]